MDRNDVQRRCVEEQQDASGHVEPEALFEAAADKNHPLHNGFGFEWNRTAAWRKYNIEVARRIIRSVQVTITVTSRSVSCPAYVRDPAKPAHEAGYIATSKLQDQRYLARQAVLSELGRVKAAVERAQSVADVLGLTQQFEGLLADVCALERVVDQRRDAAE